MVMCEFLNDDLTFIKSDTSGFDAEFELIFAIYDKNEDVLISRIVNKKLNVSSYEQTNKREKTFSHKENFKLLPGKYKLFVKSVDINSNKIAQTKVDVTVTDFSKEEISISNILFLQQVQFDSLNNLVDFQPSFGNNFDLRSGSFYIYFDIYLKNIQQPANLSYQIVNNKKIVELDSSFTWQPGQHVHSCILKMDKKHLMHNMYTVDVKVKAGENSTKRVQDFSFHWSNIPGTVKDISLAIQQMAYILSSDTLKKYMNADFQNKQEFFKRFWQDHDPDVQTTRNELKNEYFQRVNYANQHYKAMGQSGWKTDMVRILIKFGSPDDIDRHPFEIDRKPYQIWRYYSLRKVFYFMDVTGFGDYRLHPDFINVEYQ